MKLGIFFLLGLCSMVSWAESHNSVSGRFIPRLGLTLEATSLSLAEQSTTKGGSYSGTAVNLGVNYPFYQTINRSYFIKSSVPVVAKSGAGLYSATLGMNFFQDKLSAPYTLEDGPSVLKIRPKLQYFWGPHIGAGALIYTVDSAKKSDFGFIVGAQGGMMKQLKAPWGLKADLGLSKGFGMSTGFLTYFVGGGATYDLD